MTDRTSIKIVSRHFREKMWTCISDPLRDEQCQRESLYGYAYGAVPSDQ